MIRGDEVTHDQQFQLRRENNERSQTQQKGWFENNNFLCSIGKTDSLVMFFQRTAIKSHIQQDIHMYFFF